LKAVREEKILLLKNKNMKRQPNSEMMKKIEKSLEAQEKWEEESKLNRETVHEENVAEVVSMMTGFLSIELHKQKATNFQNYQNLSMARSLVKTKLLKSGKRPFKETVQDLKDPNKPIGSFIFLGQTGVGKTQLAKVLAKELFDIVKMH